MSLTANVADWGSLRVLFEESDHSGEFASFLANFERYIHYVCVLRFRLPNEAEEIVSAVRIRLVEALQDEEFRIRVSVEAFLKSLIYQEIRDLLKEQRKFAFMKQFYPEKLAEIPDQQNLGSACPFNFNGSRFSRMNQISPYFPLCKIGGLCNSRFSPPLARIFTSLTPIYFGTDMPELIQGSKRFCLRDDLKMVPVSVVARKRK